MFSAFFFFLILLALQRQHNRGKANELDAIPCCACTLRAEPEDSAVVQCKQGINLSYRTLAADDLRGKESDGFLKHRISLQH